MNDFIKLHKAVSKEKICIRKKDIHSFEESIIGTAKDFEECTQIFLSEDEELWFKVTETVDEIMEILEHE